MRVEANNDVLGSAAPGNQSTVLSALFRLDAKPLHSTANQLSHSLDTAYHIDTDEYPTFQTRGMYVHLSGDTFWLKA